MKLYETSTKTCLRYAVIVRDGTRRYLHTGEVDMGKEFVSLEFIVEQENDQHQHNTLIVAWKGPSA